MIQIEHLQKIIASQVVLDIDALQISSGEIAAVTGATGSGIETFFDLLTGRMKPSAGNIRMAEIDPVDKESFSRKVGILFPEDALYRRQTPKSNLLLLCRIYGFSPRRALEVLEQIGMADQANASVEKLPSSLLRRLAFGRAILHNPPVLLLAEPFARCDETTVTLISRLIRKQSEDNCAVLILSEDATNLEGLCDKIYLLQRGRLSLPAPVVEGNHPALPFKVPVRLEEKVILVNPGDILYIEAEGGHASIKTAEARLGTQFSLNELEERLRRSGFFRAHRSYLVNLQHIKEIIPYTRNSFSLRLDDASGTEIPLSKSAAGELRELLNY